MEQNKAITGSVWIEKVLHCVTVEGPGTMPPTDHVPWLLGQGHIPIL